MLPHVPGLLVLLCQCHYQKKQFPEEGRSARLPNRSRVDVVMERLIRVHETTASVLALTHPVRVVVCGEECGVI